MERGGEPHRGLDALAGLRDAVCHVQDFAATPEQALTVPARVREAATLADWLQRALIEQAP